MPRPVTIKDDGSEVLESLGSMYTTRRRIASK